MKHLLIGAAIAASSVFAQAGTIMYVTYVDTKTNVPNGNRVNFFDTRGACGAGRQEAMFIFGSGRYIEGCWWLDKQNEGVRATIGGAPYMFLWDDLQRTDLFVGWGARLAAEERRKSGVDK
jgi:hypothetical protein